MQLIPRKRCLRAQSTFFEQSHYCQLPGAASCRSRRLGENAVEGRSSHRTVAITDTSALLPDVALGDELHCFTRSRRSSNGPAALWRCDPHLVENAPAVRGELAAPGVLHLRQLSLPPRTSVRHAAASQKPERSLAAARNDETSLRAITEGRTALAELETKNDGGS